MKRVVNIKVLPGEPLDGSGRVCIHLFVQDESGPFAEPSTLYMEEVSEDGEAPTKRLISRPARGRLACNPNRKVAPVVQGNVTTITMRSDDPRAVTCPKCKASVDYSNMMELMEAAEARR